ncbi:MAG: phosphonoacetaldehyde reductase, partial [Lachnoclostridium sp.]|nr:phosphonoacetaldehyde reductase [Lachnoclostridium sp.]MCM1385666.1 phosphonoacetaldehyde reductase [Lachnoclostridium sp.]
VGGGSAMDVAKCIKLFSNMKQEQNYLEQPVIPNGIEFLAVPTTAGTGSEATRFAVIYYNGEKQSVADDSCMPSAVLMDPAALETLPEYQKKATMMDALCHATESFWSIHANGESRRYSAEAIKLVFENYKGYLSNVKTGNAGMLKAANMAGKAINITQTTAGHAMCYKITSLFGVSHGHAAALCVSKLFPFMVRNTDKCVDPRGRGHLEDTFAELAEAYGCSDALSASEKFNGLLDELHLETPTASEKDYEVLKNSVNPERLKNNPVGLDVRTMDVLYHEILQKRDREMENG